MNPTVEKWIKQERMSKLEAVERNRENWNKYYKNNTEKVKERNKKRYNKIRGEIIQQLGGGCVFCGEEDPNMLNFHHTVPMLVLENKIYHYKRNVDILCLLCVDCHITYHNMMDWLGIDDIFKEE